MPLTYQIHEEGMLLKILGHEKVVLSDFSILSEDLDGKLKEGFRMFCDLTTVDHFALSPNDIKKLVTLHLQIPERERSAKAVTVTRSGHDYAMCRMFQMLLMDDRFVTTDFEEAWAWLNAPSETVEASSLEEDGR